MINDRRFISSTVGPCFRPSCEGIELLQLPFYAQWPSRWSIGMKGIFIELTFENKAFFIFRAVVALISL